MLSIRDNTVKEELDKELYKVLPGNLEVHRARLHIPVIFNSTLHFYSTTGTDCGILVPEILEGIPTPNKLGCLSICKDCLPYDLIAESTILLEIMTTGNKPLRWEKDWTLLIALCDRPHYSIDIKRRARFHHARFRDTVMRRENYHDSRLRCYFFISGIRHIERAEQTC